METASRTIGDRLLIDIADGVADVRLSRADRMNAIDLAMFHGLIEAGEWLAGQTQVRAVVLSGEGRAFCAGLDMNLFGTFASGDGNSLFGDIKDRTHGRANAPQQAVLTWRDLPVPVIAAVHGVAFGGGFQIALAADIRCVAPDARLSAMEIRWGLVPDMGGVMLMRELARADIVRELTYTGRIFSGEEALALGFATQLHADPLAAALALARDIAGRSPDAVRAAKRLMNSAFDGDAAMVLMAESVEQERLIGSPNQIEAVRAGMEKRAAIFQDPER